MAGLRNKLTATTVRSTTRTGLHADGAGLYLQVTRNPNHGHLRKSWLVRFQGETGRIREVGIGSAEHLSLADAREKAAIVRKEAKAGVKEVTERQKERKAAVLKQAREMTFAQCAEAYIAAHKTSWKNDKHKAQWGATLKTYAYPVFGKVPVADITVAMIMKVLDPIWTTKTETASRLRGRIENVLDWATVREYRTGENPARWRGHLEKALPAAKSKARRVKHHAALPIDDVPTFMSALSKQAGTAALAFRFAILTAARTSEVLGARWDEIDFEERAWLIPEERMKAGRAHRVPLSQAALDVLEAMRGKHPDFIFPSTHRGKALSNMAFLMTLRRMDRTDLTAHGFRSTFRDWAAERTDIQNEVAEAALAHTISNKAEAAYRRGDLFEKRRALMDAWAGFAMAGGVGTKGDQSAASISPN
jgi:integrase